MFQDSDVAACGFLQKLKQVKFLGTIYICAEVFPKLSALPKAFQADKINFSTTLQAVAHTKSHLETIKAESTALDALEKDIDGSGFISTEVKMSRKDTNQLVSIERKYVDSLIKNTDKRFQSLGKNGVLLAFGIFDPVLVPGTDDAGFKAYGQDKVKALAFHFFPADEGANDKLQSQWNQIKYHVNENVKRAIPEEVKNGTCDSSTAWFMSQLMKNKVNYQPFFDMLLQIAEIVLTLPGLRGGMCNETREDQM